MLHKSKSEHALSCLQELLAQKGSTMQPRPSQPCNSEASQDASGADIPAPDRSQRRECLSAQRMLSLLPQQRSHMLRLGTSPRFAHL